MAKKESDTEGASAKKKSKLPLIIIVVVVALAGGGGGAFWVMKSHGSADPKAAAAKKKAEQVAKPPLYTQLDQGLTTALSRSDAEDHYLQVEIKIKIADEHVAEKITQRSPEIRNALILLMTSKSADDLKNVEDKQKLAAEMAREINKVIQAEHPEEGALGVYFTSFILQ